MTIELASTQDAATVSKWLFAVKLIIDRLRAMPLMRYEAEQEGCADALGYAMDAARLEWHKLPELPDLEVPAKHERRSPREYLADMLDCLRHDQEWQLPLEALLSVLQHYYAEVDMALGQWVTEHDYGPRRFAENMSGGAS